MLFMDNNKYLPLTGLLTADRLRELQTDRRQTKASLNGGGTTLATNS